MEEITITSVVKSSDTKYDVFFNKNFTMTNLAYSISADGVIWQAPVSFITFTSPKKITVTDMTSFYVKLISDFADPIENVYNAVYNNVYN